MTKRNRIMKIARFMLKRGLPLLALPLFALDLLRTPGLQARQPLLVLQENNPPQVKIVSPAGKSVHSWGTQVRYTISVSDKEDGESAYQEINAGEVYLEVRHVPDASRLDSYLKETRSENSAIRSHGLRLIQSSDCFTCHSLKDPLIGPSFREIAGRYSSGSSVEARLSKHVMEGSSGVWGDTMMPAHPALSSDEVRQMVRWILQEAGDPGLDIYRGLEGSFWLRGAEGQEKGGAFILTASYVDKGWPDETGKRLSGEDVLVVYPE